MIDFKKYPILGILVYGLLLISCLLELSVELGIHEFDDFASHHGLAIFALGSLFANWDDMSKSLKDFKNQERKEDWSDQEFNQVRYGGVVLKSD